MASKRPSGVRRRLTPSRRAVSPQDFRYLNTHPSRCVNTHVNTCATNAAKLHLCQRSPSPEVKPSISPLTETTVSPNVTTHVDTERGVRDPIPKKDNKTWSDDGKGDKVGESLDSSIKGADEESSRLQATHPILPYGNRKSLVDCCHDWDDPLPPYMPPAWAANKGHVTEETPVRSRAGHDLETSITIHGIFDKIFEPFCSQEPDISAASFNENCVNVHVDNNRNNKDNDESDDESEHETEVKMTFSEFLNLPSSFGENLGTDKKGSDDFVVLPTSTTQVMSQHQKANPDNSKKERELWKFSKRHLLDKNSDLKSKTISDVKAGEELTESPPPSMSSVFSRARQMTRSVMDRVRSRSPASSEVREALDSAVQAGKVMLQKSRDILLSTNCILPDATNSSESLSMQHEAIEMTSFCPVDKPPDDSSKCVQPDQSVVDEDETFMQVAGQILNKEICSDESRVIETEDNCTFPGETVVEDTVELHVDVCEESQCICISPDSVGTSETLPEQKVQVDTTRVCSVVKKPDDNKFVPLDQSLVDGNNPYEPIGDQIQSNEIHSNASTTDMAENDISHSDAWADGTMKLRVNIGEECKGVYLVPDSTGIIESLPGKHELVEKASISPVGETHDTIMWDRLGQSSVNKDSHSDPVVEQIPNVYIRAISDAAVDETINIHVTDCNEVDGMEIVPKPTEPENLGDVEAVEQVGERVVCSAELHVMEKGSSLVCITSKHTDHTEDCTASPEDQAPKSFDIEANVYREATHCTQPFKESDNHLNTTLDQTAAASVTTQGKEYEMQVVSDQNNERGISEEQCDNDAIDMKVVKKEAARQTSSQVEIPAEDVTSESEDVVRKTLSFVTSTDADPQDRDLTDVIALISEEVSIRRFPSMADLTDLENDADHIPSAAALEQEYSQLCRKAEEPGEETSAIISYEDMIVVKGDDNGDDKGGQIENESRDLLIGQVLNWIQPGYDTDDDQCSSDLSSSEEASTRSSSQRQATATTSSATTPPNSPLCGIEKDAQNVSMMISLFETTSILCASKSLDEHVQAASPCSSQPVNKDLGLGHVANGRKPIAPLAFRSSQLTDKLAALFTSRSSQCIGYHRLEGPSHQPFALGRQETSQACESDVMPKSEKVSATGDECRISDTSSEETRQADHTKIGEKEKDYEALAARLPSPPPWGEDESVVEERGGQDDNYMPHENSQPCSSHGWRERSKNDTALKKLSELREAIKDDACHSHDIETAHTTLLGETETETDSNKTDFEAAARVISTLLSSRPKMERCSNPSALKSPNSYGSSVCDVPNATDIEMHARKEDDPPLPDTKGPHPPKALPRLHKKELAPYADPSSAQDPHKEWLDKKDTSNEITPAACTLSTQTTSISGWQEPSMNPKLELPIASAVNQSDIQESKSVDSLKSSETCGCSNLIGSCQCFPRKRPAAVRDAIAENSKPSAVSLQHTGSSLCRDKEAPPTQSSKPRHRGKITWDLGGCSGKDQFQDSEEDSDTDGYGDGSDEGYSDRCNSCLPMARDSHGILSGDASPRRPRTADFIRDVHKLHPMRSLFPPIPNGIYAETLQEGAWVDSTPCYRSTRNAVCENEKEEEEEEIASVQNHYDANISTNYYEDEKCRNTQVGNLTQKAIKQRDPIVQESNTATAQHMAHSVGDLERDPAHSSRRSALKRSGTWTCSPSKFMKRDHSVLLRKSIWDSMTRLPLVHQGSADFPIGLMANAGDTYLKPSSLPSTPQLLGTSTRPKPLLRSEVSEKLPQSSATSHCCLTLSDTLERLDQHVAKLGHTKTKMEAALASTTRAADYVTRAQARLEQCDVIMSRSWAALERSARMSAVVRDQMGKVAQFFKSNSSYLSKQ